MRKATYEITFKRHSSSDTVTVGIAVENDEVVSYKIEPSVGDSYFLPGWAGEALTFAASEFGLDDSTGDLFLADEDDEDDE